MPHPTLINKTGFAFEALLLTDEEGVSQFVPCVQAVFTIGVKGTLELVEKQPPVNVGGKWRGDPAVTSMVYEPQIAFVKPSTDVVLLGHAFALTAGSTEGLVGIRVGPVQKVAKVFGERIVASRLGHTSISPPAPFERIPIIYERAFGGWDRHDVDPNNHRNEVRNPVGVGFRVTPTGPEEQRLPNFENPQQLFRSWGDTPPPVGFGFVSPNWQPRLSFAGTYDAAWNNTRKPLLPKDFSRSFFNAASPGLITPTHLRGNEPVTLLGVSTEGRIDFNLPNLQPPVCKLELRGRKWVPLQTVLDTVIVDMDLRTLTLMWRATVAVRNGPHDVLTVEVHPDQESATRVSIPVA